MKKDITFNTHCGRLFIAVLFCIMLWIPRLLVGAESGWNFGSLPEEPMQAEFSVRIIHPENQVDMSAPYFDILTVPDMEQMIQVELINHTEEAITIETAVSNATTNRHGEVVYQSFDYERDTTLPHQFTDILRFDRLTHVPARSSVFLAVHISLPADPFDGILAGGLFFRLQGSGSDRGTVTAGGEPLPGKVNYLFALILRQGSNVQPQIVLNGIEIEEKEDSTVVTALLQNVMPAFVTDMVLMARITREHDGAAIYERVFTDLEVAPNSAFPFAIDLGAQILPEDDYVLTLEMQSNELEWERISGFSVAAEVIEEDISDVQEADLVPEPDATTTAGRNILIAVIVFGTVLLFLLVLYLLKRHTKRSETLGEAQREILTFLLREDE
ncbi:MAG: DUF916 and DUF3324 domain-containing protein [Lachnospiraceae bacterium]|nr:DUF916 and DUF3324 domain-containing protein [Lachnospiraceae bacterium]